MSNIESATMNPLIKHDLEKLILTRHEKEVLQNLFPRHKQVIVVEEFRGGFSGGRVLRVLPTDKQNTAKLPAVVKLGPASLIAQEQKAYETYIEGYLPLTIPITRYRLSGDQQWGGFRYHLVGEGIFKFQDLLAYFQSSNTNDILAVLKKQLLPAIGTLHKASRRDQVMTIQSSYDKVLPVYLTISPAKVLDTEDQRSKDASILTPEHTNTQFDMDQPIYVKGFSVTEVNSLEQSVTLNLTFNQSPYDSSLRIRLGTVHDMEAFEVGQVMPPVEGTVMQTRETMLGTEIFEALNGDFQFNDTTIELGDGTTLPYPLPILPSILNETLSHPAIGNVHGDLNLHNVMHSIESRTLNFIDFAAASKDHLLHDFLRLERGVVTELISHIMAESEGELISDLIHPFYEYLHSVCTGQGKPLRKDWMSEDKLQKPFEILRTIRQEAQKSFQDPEDWTEYYKCLAIYLVSSLKFPNLDKRSKQLAILGAASLLKRMEIETSKSSQMQPPMQPHPIPLGVFDRQHQIMRNRKIETIGNVTVVPVRPMERAGFPVLSRHIGYKTAHIRAEKTEKTITLEGWNPKVEPEFIEYSRLLERWPNNDHNWKFESLALDQKFNYPNERIESFDKDIIAAAWWIEHQAGDKSTENFLILIGSVTKLSE